MTSAPAVSVLIPVHNRRSLVGDAIASILGQSFADFELVVIDDGSTDGSMTVVEGFGDDRLRIVRHDRNRGIPAARNTGLAAARGRYIAWLDSDDVARPDRLAAQVAFLDANPAIALVGGAAGKLRKDGTRKRGVRIPPFAPGDVAAWLLFRSAFQQSSVMGRAELLQATPYRAEFDVCEDLDVFVRLSRDHALANLPQVLIDRRLHPGQTVRQRQARIRERKAHLYAPWLSAIGMAFDDEDLRRHTLLGKTALDGVDLPPDFLDWAENWLRTLRARNAVSGVVDRAGMTFACGWFWVLACRVAGRPGRAVGSPLVAGLAAGSARRWMRHATPLLLLRR